MHQATGKEHRGVQNDGEKVEIYGKKMLMRVVFFLIYNETKHLSNTDRHWTPNAHMNINISNTTTVQEIILFVTIFFISLKMLLPFLFLITVLNLQSSAYCSVVKNDFTSE